MQCFACGADHHLASGERVGFRDSCSECDADLHVCRNCRHHDPSAYNECRESGAERVGDRTRANRCEWFGPGTGGGGEAEAQRSAARDQLDALFKKG